MLFLFEIKHQDKTSLIDPSSCGLAKVAVFNMLFDDQDSLGIGMETKTKHGV